MHNKVHVDRASTKIITMVSVTDVLQVYFLFLQITQPLSMEEISAGGTALYSGTILSRSNELGCFYAFLY